MLDFWLRKGKAFETQLGKIKAPLSAMFTAWTDLKHRNLKSWKPKSKRGGGQNAYSLSGPIHIININLPPFSVLRMYLKHR
jgi:hypothetical protein